MFKSSLPKYFGILTANHDLLSVLRNQVYILVKIKTVRWDGLTYLLVLSRFSTFLRSSLFSLEHVSTLWTEAPLQNYKSIQMNTKSIASSASLFIT